MGGVCFWFTHIYLYRVLTGIQNDQNYHGLPIIPVFTGLRVMSDFSILYAPMNTPFSLYVHIPFCVHRCAYCDFNTYAGISEMIPAYVQALCHEIELSGVAASSSSGEPTRVHSVFFGGGTPSLLALEHLALILAEMRDSFQFLPDVEITLEANPGTVDRDYLVGLKALGINRLSLGMQSAHPDDLRILERQHNLDDVVQAVRWSRLAGFENINLDLIFGIPHQSLDSWQHTLDMALSLNPEHLSLYALTLEHGTPMDRWVGRGLIPEPDQDLAADMYEYAQQRLDDAGYLQYEISNWARQVGGERLACRHNLQYWRSLPYLGFGAGAHGYAAGYRTANVLSPSAYIQRLGNPEGATEPVFPSTPATVEFVPIDRQTEMGELMMMGLRLVQEGISDAQFTAHFGQTLSQVYEAQIKHLIQSGLLEWFQDGTIGRSLRLTKPGRLLGNRVFREFI